MDILIWVGALVTLGGLGLLVWCILGAMRVRRDAANDEDLKTGLQKLAAVNMAALGISAIGLMMVIIGIALG